MCEAISFLLDNIFMKLGTKLYQQVVGIPVCYGRAHHDPECGLLMFWFKIASKASVLFHHSVCNYVCLTVMFSDEVEDLFADRIGFLRKVKQC